MLPKKIYLNYIDESDSVRIFSEESFAGFSHMKSRKYTDLSQVWHSASEEPKCKRLLIIYRDDIGCIPIDTLIYHGDADCHWKELVKRYNIIYWAYAKDLLPKGGEK